jgi:RNA polymerase sigma factor (TIGR02999 family)
MSKDEPAAGSVPEPGPADPELLAAVERELHGIAERLLRGERKSHTLQPTALMHEAWLRLAHVHAPWNDRAHFVRTAARTMRRVLIDHARAHARAVHGKGVTLATDIAGGAAPNDVLVVHEALEALGVLDPELEQIVELRVFGGLDNPEIAALTGRSLRTVERGWRSARAFLRQKLGGGSDAT